MLDSIIFLVLPYLALALALFVTPYRFLTNRLTWTSYSTQFLERKVLYWGSMPWHYGIIVVLAAHLLFLILPGPLQSFLGKGRVLLVLESIGLGLGLLALFGILVLLMRRSEVMLRQVTTPADWVVLCLLALQTATGVYIAFALRWGSVWSLHTAVPYLHSVLLLSPKPSLVADLPLLFKLHTAGAFLLLALLPFTKLVHLLYLPVTFLRDPPILYRWWQKPERREGRR